MLIIGNGTVYTGGKDKRLIGDGAVVVEGEKILEVGSFKSFKGKYPDADVIDAKGMFIMPGFINNHEHIYSAFARGLDIPGEPAKDFLGILESLWWKIDRHLTLEQTYYSAVATYIESIKNGVTFVSDHHASYFQIPGSLSEIEKAARKLGVRTCLCYEVSDRDGRKKRDEAIAENADFFKKVAAEKDPMVSGLFGLHASFTLSNETLRLCREVNEDEVGYHVHVAEGIWDNIQCEDEYGMSVVERLYRNDILRPNSVAGHCIHIDSRDIDILKESGTTVIYNPESNMGNAVGAPDVIGLLDKGVRVGLGTDGYTHDILESLKVANILQKHRRGFPDRGFAEALTCLENNAAIASDIVGEKVGVLEEGALADIILVDYKPNTPITADNFDGHLMFGMSGAMVNTTIINGKIVMKNRVLVDVDEDKILADCSKSAESLWKVLKG